MSITIDYKHIAVVLFLLNMLAYGVLICHQPMGTQASCSDDRFAIVSKRFAFISRVRAIEGFEISGTMNGSMKTTFKAATMHDDQTEKTRHDNKTFVTSTSVRCKSKQ